MALKRVPMQQREQLAEIMQKERLVMENYCE